MFKSVHFFSVLLAITLTSACTQSEDTATPVPATQKEQAQKEPAEEQAEQAPIKSTYTQPTADMKCTYAIDKVIPTWTAYKTTEKVAVSGTFNTVELKIPKREAPAATLAELLTGLEMTITPASVESKNPVRNQTIATQFFAQFVAPESITGTVKQVQGDAQKGTLIIATQMNGAQHDLSYDYVVDAQGQLKATSNQDMIKLGLQKAYDAIHKSCEDLHKGPDGISKTFTEFMLEISAELKQDCQKAEQPQT